MMSQCNFIYAVPSIDNNMRFSISYLLSSNLIGFSGRQIKMYMPRYLFIVHYPLVQDSQHHMGDQYTFEGF
jgi:hypothetical protein